MAIQPNPTPTAAKPAKGKNTPATIVLATPETSGAFAHLSEMLADATASLGTATLRMMIVRMVYGLIALRDIVGRDAADDAVAPVKVQEILAHIPAELKGGMKLWRDNLSAFYKAHRDRSHGLAIVSAKEMKGQAGDMLAASKRKNAMIAGYYAAFDTAERATTPKQHTDALASLILHFQAWDIRSNDKLQTVILSKPSGTGNTAEKREEKRQEKQAPKDEAKGKDAPKDAPKDADTSKDAPKDEAKGKDEAARMPGKAIVNVAEINDLLGTITKTIGQFSSADPRACVTWIDGLVENLAKVRERAMAMIAKGKAPDSVEDTLPPLASVAKGKLRKEKHTAMQEAMLKAEAEKGAGAGNVTPGMVAADQRKAKLRSTARNTR